MATIRSAIELQDNFSRVLYGVVNAVNITISSMEEMSGAMNADMHVDTSSLQLAREEISRATSGLQQMTAEVQEIEEPVRRVHSGFSGWQKAIMVANQAVGLIQNTVGRIGITDMSGAFDRMDTMNRFHKTITAMTGDAGMANTALEEIKENVLGTAYGLDVAAKSVQGFTTRGMSLGTAVDQVRVWSDAVSFHGKGTNEQLEGVVDAVGKILSKGTVEANQLDRLFDAGIPAVEMYADAVGRSVGEVKDALSNREISSAEFIQTVSEVLDAGVSHGAAKSAGDTWATTFANMRASFSRGWVDVIESLDAALASHGLPSSMQMITALGTKVESVLGNVGDSLDVVVGIASGAGEILGGAGSFVVDNWSIISPVIYGVGTALLIYAGYLGIVKIAELASVAVKGAASIAAYIHVAAMNAEARAGGRAALAQRGLNSALLACPLTWIVIAIIAVIVVIYMVVGAINKATGSTISATGVIVGALSVVGAAIWNTFLGALDIILGFINHWANLLIEFGNFMANVFHNPISSVIYLFQGLGDAALAVIEKIASGMDYVFGSNMADTVGGWRESLKDMADTAVKDLAPDETYVEFAKKLDLSTKSMGLERIEYTQAYQNGYKIGKDLEEKFDLKKMFGGVEQAENKMDKIKQELDRSALTSSLGNTDKNTDKIAKKLEVTSEDIKYIRDFATQRAINRYTSTMVKVDMTNHNSIHGEKDVDGIVNTLKSRIQEEMNHSAEGVH